MTQELLEEVRRTRTVDGGRGVYALADIGIEDFDPNEVKPTALYVTRPQLERLESLRREVDIFQLEDKVPVNGHVIAPPVVEDIDGQPSVIDGQHRFWLARRDGKRVKAIHVKGSDPSIPVISYPVEWSEVKEYDVKPEDPALLRRMRVDDTDGTIRQYYRDLSFLGSTGRRKREGQ